MIRTDDKSQLEAKEYVLNKPILRPDTKWWYPVLLVLFSFLLGVGTSVIMIKLLCDKFILNCYIKTTIVIVLIITVQLLTVKRVLILSVKSYQHYALENIRRCCLCKPTCSEYALIVLNKYNVIKALRLIDARVKKTCTGNIYKIDFPE